ncbi:MAG: phosphoesterase PA-phosphatase related protein [uncultured bacterium]|nr:MAG: phosphoesterase PA-phosphatase related protein [uncultured bacterium]
MHKQAVRFFKFLFSSRLNFALFLQIFAVVLISLVSLYVFLKISHDVFESELFLFDSTLTNFLFSLRSPMLTDIMISITSLGSVYVLLIASLSVAFYLFIKRRRDAVIYLMFLYSGVFLNLILKLMYQRPRPSLHPLINENTYSFPSGHAMNSFVFFSAMTYLVLRQTKNKKLRSLVLIVSIAAVLAIGVSRVYLGVHYPSDVVAGYIAGFLWFVSAILLEKTIIFDRLYKSFRK